LIVLAILIFVHELGHFLTAKMFGIRVDEFAIGFPPKIFSFSLKKGNELEKVSESEEITIDEEITKDGVLKETIIDRRREIDVIRPNNKWQFWFGNKKGNEEEIKGTVYTVNLIPFGGFVKIFGENPNDESIDGPDSKRSFVNVSKWRQIVVLLAGISMNIIFAWLLISASFNIGLVTSIDNQYKDNAKDVSVIVTSVMKDSPAENAGMRPGDRIIKISSKKNPSIEDVQNMIAKSSGKLDIEYKRGNATGTVEVIATDNIVNGRKAIGISMDMAGVVKFGFFRSFLEGAKLTVIETKNIAVGICEFIKGAVTGQAGILSDVSGPVGIANMVGQAESMGLSYLLGFIAIISINLAVLNLIPFPALDGGRALFVIIEAVIRRRIKPAILNWTNAIGFAILIVFMLFITYKDIAKLF
jgi:regulator of sigma E protease